MDAYQHLAITDLRLGDLPRLQGLERPVSVLHDRLHGNHPLPHRLGLEPEIHLAGPWFVGDLRRMRQAHTTASDPWPECARCDTGRITRTVHECHLDMSFPAGRLEGLVTLAF